jgi:hypothetical protein
MSDTISKNINFLRARPITLDGSYVDPFNDPTQIDNYPYKQDSYYYYMINNIPIIRHENRDQLIAAMLESFSVSTFPSVGNLGNVTDVEGTPVIVDFLAGSIHRNFSKGSLYDHERVGFIVKNLATGATYFVNNGVKNYYVALTIDSILLPYSSIIDSPNTNPTKQALPPESTELFISTSGNSSGFLCTKNLSKRLKDANGVNLEIGVIKSNLGLAKASFICALGAEARFGPSVQMADKNHGDLSDLVSSTHHQDDATLFVYGHYGHKTRVKAVPRSQFSGAVEVGDPIMMRSDGVLLVYTRALNQTMSTVVKQLVVGSPLSSTNTPTQFENVSQAFAHTSVSAVGVTTYDFSSNIPFVGFVLYESDSTVYLVQDGEWIDTSASFTPGKIYYLDKDGNYSSSLSSGSTTDNLLTACCKLGVSLDQHTLLLEPGSTQFAKNTLDGYGRPSPQSVYDGRQISAELRGSGFPGHRRYLTNREGFGPFTHTSTPFEILDSQAKATEGVVTRYALAKNGWASGMFKTSAGVYDNHADLAWGVTKLTYPATVASGWQGAYGEYEIDYGHVGVKPPKASLIIQKLSPEFTSGDAVMERVLVFAYTDVGHIDWLNDSEIPSTGQWKFFRSGIPMTSATETGRLLQGSFTNSVSSLDYDGRSASGIPSAGMYKTLTVQLRNTSDFNHSPTPLVKVDPNTNQYRPDVANPITGISLKNQHGVFAFSTPPPPPKALGASTAFPGATKSACFVNYGRYEITSTPARSGDAYTYTFYDCYVNSKDNSFATNQSGYDRLVSFPTGAFSFDTQINNNSTYVAGLYNGSPHLLNWLNKHKNSWWGVPYFDEVSTTKSSSTTTSVTKQKRPTFLPAPMGTAYIGMPAINTNNGDQSLFSDTTLSDYNNTETLTILPAPINPTNLATKLGPSVYSYYYANFNTFYGNSHLLAKSSRGGILSSSSTAEAALDTSKSNSAVSLVTSNFRFNTFAADKNRYGMFIKPWSAVDKDAFWFGSPWNLTVGPTLRTGEYIPWHGYGLVGVSFIVYIYRQQKNNTDYVDISLDPTALPFQVFGTYVNNPVSPNTVTADIAQLTGVDRSPKYRKNYDLITLVNGSYKAYGPGDSIRIMFAASAPEPSYLAGATTDICTMNMPSLTLNYTTAGGTSSNSTSSGTGSTTGTGSGVPTTTNTGSTSQGVLAQAGCVEKSVQVKNSAGALVSSTILDCPDKPLGYLGHMATSGADAAMPDSSAYGQSAQLSALMSTSANRSSAVGSGGSANALASPTTATTTGASATSPSLPTAVTGAGPTNVLTQSGGAAPSTGQPPPIPIGTGVDLGWWWGNFGCVVLSLEAARRVENCYGIGLSEMTEISPGHYLHCCRTADNNQRWWETTTSFLAGGVPKINPAALPYLYGLTPPDCAGTTPNSANTDAQTNASQLKPLFRPYTWVYTKAGVRVLCKDIGCADTAYGNNSGLPLTDTERRDLCAQCWGVIDKPPDINGWPTFTISNIPLCHSTGDTGGGGTGTGGGGTGTGGGGDTTTPPINTGINYWYNRYTVASLFPSVDDPTLW